MSSAVTLPEPSWQAAVDALGGARSAALGCHVGPDGDGIGSMLAAGLALRDRSRADAAAIDVVCGWDAGDGRPAVPEHYGFLPGQGLLAPAADMPAHPDVFLAFDTGSVERLGRLADVAERAATVCVLDHHASGAPFGDVRLVDTGAAATGLIAEELIRRLGCSLTADIATCLYTAVVTDTGSFKFAATTAAVHEVAARLLATGIAHDVISRRIWDTAPFGYLGLLGMALTRARLEPDAAGGHGVVWTSVSADDLAGHGLGLADIEDVIDTLRVTQEAEVAVVLKQGTDRRWQASTRSKGAVDVGAVCSALGGGGHRFAAGYTSYDDLDTTVDKLRAALASAPGTSAR
jgi:phosphoesterase RecJ-like protein